MRALVLAVAVISACGAASPAQLALVPANAATPFATAPPAPALRGAVEGFLAEVPAAFTIARDPTMTVRSAPLGITRLPTVLIIDRGGRVRVRGEELPEERYDELPALVEALLAE